MASQRKFRMDNEITDLRLDKYIKLTEKALKKAKLSKNLSEKEMETAKIYYNMAKSYLSDAKHFKEKGSWVDAFGAVNYAHAWLDAGAMQGLFDVDRDNRLFTVD